MCCVRTEPQCPPVSPSVPPWQWQLEGPKVKTSAPTSRCEPGQARAFLLIKQTIFFQLLFQSPALIKINKITNNDLETKILIPYLFSIN